jgi:hypothetical protein
MVAITFGTLHLRLEADRRVTERIAELTTIQLRLPIRPAKRMSSHKPIYEQLIPYENVGTPLDHLTRPAAVLIAIYKPVSFEVIEKDSLTTLNRLPRIVVTTM